MTSRCPEPTPARPDHRRRRRWGLAVIGAGSALALGVPPALAASPVNGKFTGTGKGACKSMQIFACNGGEPYGAVEPFSLKVSKGKVVRLKFKFPLGAPDNDFCGNGSKSPVPFQIDLRSISLPVSRSGKFKLRKTVPNPTPPPDTVPHNQLAGGPGPTKIRVDGKFTGTKTATGTFTITFNPDTEACDSQPYEWTAKHK